MIYFSLGFNITLDSPTLHKLFFCVNNSFLDIFEISSVIDIIFNQIYDELNKLENEQQLLFSNSMFYFQLDFFK